MNAAPLGRPRLFSALFLGDTWPLWGVLGLFSLVLALMFSLSQHQLLPGQMSALLVLQTVLAVAAPAVGLASLARVRRVMDAALMPRAGLQRHARQLAWLLWGWWALLSLPTVLLILLLTPGFDSAPVWQRAVGAPAWLALAMGLSALMALAWGGLLAGAWLALPLAGWGLLLWLGGEALWAAWQPAWWLHLACLLALPLLLQALVRHQPRVVQRGPALPQRLLRTIQSLESRRAWLAQSHRSLGSLIWVEWMAFSLFTRGSNLPLWGDTQGPGAVLRVLLLATLFTGLLQSRDLHWRMLLAPRGALRQRLGLRVWRDSLAGMGLILALVVPVLLLLDGSARGWDVPRWLGLGLPLGLEIVLAMGLAVLARGLFQRALRAVVALGLLMLLWLPVVWLAPGWMAWTRGPGQMLVLAVASVLLVPLVQRSWQRMDMAELLASAASAASASGKDPFQADGWTPRR